MNRYKLTSAMVLLAFIVILAGCGGVSSGNLENASSQAEKTTGISNKPEQTTFVADVTGAKKISPADAKALLDKDSSIILLDVREPDEYAVSHIDKSILLPLGDVSAKVETVVPDKKTTIIVYCRSGRRSALASTELAGLGYASIYDLGGINDWPYETVNGK